ncbi:uncharacterized protein LOC103102606 [Monodelphis domestica]|uniref:uncharacterized protein LOC103102606 n=1 Tax=Monodelphis domestica TaxID=13616 RepID=UPI0024E19DDB|nr:uncharacterized protein LOC103102606 [Monodelphis domestica]
MTFLVSSKALHSTGTSGHNSAQTTTKGRSTAIGASFTRATQGDTQQGPETTVTRSREGSTGWSSPKNDITENTNEDAIIFTRATGKIITEMTTIERLSPQITTSNKENQGATTRQREDSLLNWSTQGPSGTSSAANGISGNPNQGQVTSTGASGTGRAETSTKGRSPAVSSSSSGASQGATPQATGSTISRSSEAEQQLSVPLGVPGAHSNNQSSTFTLSPFLKRETSWWPHRLNQTLPWGRGIPMHNCFGISLTLSEMAHNITWCYQFPVMPRFQALHVPICCQGQEWESKAREAHVHWTGRPSPHWRYLPVNSLRLLPGSSGLHPTQPTILPLTHLRAVILGSQTGHTPFTPTSSFSHLALSSVCQ